MNRLVSMGPAVVLALVLAACGGDGKSGAGDGAPAAVQAAPDAAELASALVRGVQDMPDSVVLADGRWEGEPFVAGGAARPSVWLVSHLHLSGDFDGDGHDEAVGLVGANHGGTGDLVHLVVFGREGNTVASRAIALLGDRVQVRTALLDGNRIVLNVVQPGPKDALCCPGETAERGFEFAGGALRETPSAKTRGRLSLAALEGVTWRLRQWDRGEPAADEPAISFTVDAGLASGTAGCNRFLANLTERGRRPGELSAAIQPATYAKCGVPADSLEARFLAQFAGVTQYSFLATRLALTYARGDGLGTMLFEAETP